MSGEGDGYDVVVVGSGYGGSVAACRLSMAGLKVCLVEKGRRWEARDFPTDSFQMLSACRFQNKNLGISFGPKDALFQVLCVLFNLSFSKSWHKKLSTDLVFGLFLYFIK